MVNCTDGVDGLSASLAVVSIGTFLLAYWEELGDYATAGIVFIGALLAYLWQNAKPFHPADGGRGQPRHGLLPGCSGPQEQPPFAFLLAALVFIVRQGVVFLLALMVCVHLFQYQGVLMAQAVADILSAALALGLLAASRDIIAKQ